MSENKNLCIIPARSGSKRILNKNLELFHGKPIIAWSIETALKSNLFDDVIVSTDSEKIAKVAETLGANVPFMRPQELSDDYTPTITVIQSAIKEYEILYSKPNYVCCLYPAAPLTQPVQLQQSLAMLVENSEKNVYCLSIAEFPSEIDRALKINEKGLFEPLFKQNQFKRSQDLEIYYYDAGQFYWASTNTWLTKNKVHENSIGFVLPKGFVVDINFEEDWKLAEILFRSIVEER